MTAATEVNIRSTIAEWMEQRLQGGTRIEDAAQETMEQVLKEGYGDLFLRTVGPSIIADTWRHFNTNTKSNNGYRRYSLNVLGRDGSLLDSLHKVGDRWMPLREMNKGMCREVQAAYNKQAESCLRQAQFFSRLGDNLKKDQTVGSRFSDEQLEGMLQEMRVE